MSIFNIPKQIENIKNGEGKCTSLKSLLLLNLLSCAVIILISELIYDIGSFQFPIVIGSVTIAFVIGIIGVLCYSLVRSAILFALTPKDLDFKTSFKIVLTNYFCASVFSIPFILLFGKEIQTVITAAIGVITYFVTVFSVNKAYGFKTDYKTVIILLLCVSSAVLSYLIG